MNKLNMVNDLFNKLRVLNKTEDSNIHEFKMVTRKNESKVLTKLYHAKVHISLMEEKPIQIKSGIMINVHASTKSIIYAKRIIFEILLHVVIKKDSVITCDELIEETKTVPTNFNEKKPL